MISKPKVDYIKDIVNINDKNLKLWIDIGYGTGKVIYRLKKYRYKAIGIEYDTRKIKFAKEQGLEIIEGLVDYDNICENIESIISTATVIFMLNALEYIKNQWSL